MFYYLKGLVTHKDRNFIAVDTGGVGYKVYTSYTTLKDATQGHELKVYTYTHIREDIFDIYGFATIEELNSFEQLITVSGVGPKAALSILSSMPTDEFALAVIKGDVKAVTKAPGIGRKIAERIILELKDKISKELGDGALADYEGASESASSVLSESVNALMVLGYSALESKGAVSSVISAGDSVESVIKKALRILMN